MKAATIGTIKNVIVFMSMLISLIMWMKLPNVVGIHYGMACNANAYGSKMILLICVFLPLFACIPIPAEEPPEVHSAEMKELYLEMIEYEKKKVKWFQFVIAILLSVIVIGTMLMAKGSVE